MHLRHHLHWKQLLTRHRFHGVSEAVSSDRRDVDSSSGEHESSTQRAAGLSEMRQEGIV